jgi:hypothetical protein
MHRLREFDSDLTTRSSSSMAPSPDYARVRARPRISANELARFMVAGDTGRIGIIKRAKVASTPVLTRYKDVRRTLSNALLTPGRARGFLESARGTFEQRMTDASLSAAVRDDAEKSIDVLDCFPSLNNMLSGYAYRDPGDRLPYLSISDVEVSVNVDLLIDHSLRGKELVGGLIFRMTKPDEEETEGAKAKRKEMGIYTATLVLMQVSTNLAGNRQPHGPLCWSVDVQNGECFEAPRQRKKRLGDIEAACSIIAAIWDRV